MKNNNRVINKLEREEELEAYRGSELQDRFYSKGWPEKQMPPTILDDMIADWEHDNITK